MQTAKLKHFTQPRPWLTLLWLEEKKRQQLIDIIKAKRVDATKLLRLAVLDKAPATSDGGDQQPQVVNSAADAFP